MHDRSQLFGDNKLILSEAVCTDSTAKPVTKLRHQSTCGRGTHTHTHTRPVRPFRFPLRPVYLATSVLKPGKNESDFFLVESPTTRVRHV